MLNRLPTVKSVEPWTPPPVISDPDASGLTITTSHYRIHTTCRDHLILRRLPVFLESAFRSYSAVLDQPLQSDKKLLVYFFNTRAQWEDFSRHWAGALAPVYLKIRAGAYYLNGASVAYHIGRDSNFAVLAHEGWHQFSDELFKFRLPAWLDEGLATNFEAYSWKNGRATFSPQINASRLMALGKSHQRGVLFSISELLTLDAGRVISHTAAVPGTPESSPQVTAYYAQLYALVRFLREYNYGRYLLGFRSMLDDARQGRWPLDPQLSAEALQRKRNPTRTWNAIVGPMIFHTYVDANPELLQEDYLNFCRKLLARTRFKKRL